MAYSSNALIVLPLGFSYLAPSSPTTFRNPPSTLTADETLSISRASSSSNVIVIEDNEDGENQVSKIALKCQHQPGSQTPQCETCKVVNVAIKQLEWHKSTLRAFAESHLQIAKQSLPFLSLEAIEANAHPNLNCRDWQSFSSATASSNIADTYDPFASNKYFRRYSLRFELWCRELGLNDERLWTDWVKNQTIEDLESMMGEEYVEDSEAAWAVGSGKWDAAEVEASFETLTEVSMVMWPHLSCHHDVSNMTKILQKQSVVCRLAAVMPTHDCLVECSQPSWLGHLPPSNSFISNQTQ